MIRRKALILLALAVLPVSAFAQPGLKVYISSDMEGIAGVVSGEQLGLTPPHDAADEAAQSERRERAHDRPLHDPWLEHQVGATSSACFLDHLGSDARQGHVPQRSGDAGSGESNSTR